MITTTRGRLRSAVLAAALATIGTAGAEPFVPASDGQVLERLPDVGAGELRQLADRRAQLAAEPRNLELALELAAAFVRLGRREGDPRYNGYAQAALAPWWDAAEPPVPVLLLRATLKQYRHAFDAALVDLDAVLERAPEHPQAWLSRAMILAVEGRPDDANEACARLTERVSPLVQAACSAHAGGLGGRDGASYQLLREAYDREAEAAPEIRVWTLTILAELALQRADGAAAEAHFRQALALGVRDPYLLGAYTDLLLDEARFAEVRELLDEETRIDPLLLRLALAERPLGDAQLADHVGLMKARFEAARRRGDSVHLREEARFTLHLLDRPAEALALARANWATQREPADARILLEAALAAGDAAAAQPVLDWLDQTGLRHARIAGLVHRLEGAAS